MRSTVECTKVGRVCVDVGMWRSNSNYCCSPKYFRFLSMATEAMNEAFLPKRTPVTSPVCSKEKKKKGIENTGVHCAPSLDSISLQGMTFHTCKGFQEVPLFA